MPRYAWNKMPFEVKRRYFELIRSGLSGSDASQRVGVSLSCGSLWFIDAGQVAFVDAPISPPFLSQDDRIEIADGLARGEPVKLIAARIGICLLPALAEVARTLGMPLRRGHPSMCEWPPAVICPMMSAPSSRLRSARTIRCTRRSVLSPELPAPFRQWRDAGHTQSLLSLLPHDRLVPAVERLGLTSHFALVQGAMHPYVHQYN